MKCKRSHYKRRWCMYPQTWYELIHHLNSDLMYESLMYLHFSDKIWNFKSRRLRINNLTHIIKDKFCSLHILFDEKTKKELKTTLPKLSFSENGLFSLKHILKNEPHDILKRLDWINILSVCRCISQSTDEYDQVAIKWNHTHREDKEFLLSKFQRQDDWIWIRIMIELLCANKRICPYENDHFPTYNYLCSKLQEINVKINITEEKFDSIGKDIEYLSEVICVSYDTIKSLFCDYEDKKYAFSIFKRVNKKKMMSDYRNTKPNTQPSISALTDNIFSQLKTCIVDIHTDELKGLANICLSEPWIFTLNGTYCT